MILAPDAAAIMSAADELPPTPDKLRTASSGMILNLGRFCERAASDMPRSVSKSCTTMAFIQSEPAAITGLSYAGSHDIISYTSPSIPRLRASSLSRAAV